MKTEIDGCSLCRAPSTASIIQGLGLRAEAQLYSLRKMISGLYKEKLAVEIIHCCRGAPWEGTRDGHDG